MENNRATALPDYPILLKLWDALGSKLIKASQGQLPSKQRVVGSNPSRDASLFKLPCRFAPAWQKNPSP
jgi:hypothetical protein